MTDYNKIEIPEQGEKIQEKNGSLEIPNQPIVPYIAGDGTGKDIAPVMRKVVSASVRKTYNEERDISWMRVYAGESAEEKYGELLPDETVEAIRNFRVAIKGPLTTPIGSGFRSLNVALRKKLDLYACVRPVYHIEGVPSPVKNPQEVDMVVFRENTEDVYAGIEWEGGTDEAAKVRDFLEDEMDVEAIHEDPVGLGVKPISEFATKRLVRRAIEHALKHDRDTVTLVHKGNIMKFTEGAFRDWGYEVAEEEYGDRIITEDELWDEYDGEQPEGKVVIKDRLADNMLQQILTRTADYDVLAMPNLNGDYISDAAGAMIGGLGIAPGANIGDGRGLFEPTHGSAPKYAGQDKVNPTAIILSACEMLRYLKWGEAAQNIISAVRKTIGQGTVTYDLARQMEDASKVKCSEYGEAVIENLEREPVAVG
ncbi:MAG: isocitrate dehydrogenase (NADP(+)) [bacterium]